MVIFLHKLIEKEYGGKEMGEVTLLSMGNAILKYPEKLILLLFVITLSGCVDVKLIPGKTSEGISIPSKKDDNVFCITDPVKESGSTKMIFVVDVSGSNGQNDADGSKRADSIDKFVRTLSVEGSYQYGLITFAGGSTSVIKDNDGNPGFTYDLNEFYKATQTIRDNPAGGGTNYLPAIAMTKRAIKNDINRFPDERSSYVVFFISDGRPNDKGSISKIVDLIGDVDITIDGRKIYLSAAFYGGESRDAINRLEEMAKEGGGGFVNFENGETWDLSQLIVQPDVVPWKIKEFLVYNLNAGFCLDGRVGVDSDADGMCDRDEIDMNDLYAKELRDEGKFFDPANRFSFGDGYGDFFHWLRFKYPGKSLLPCQDRSDEDFDLLTKCEENEIENRSAADGTPTTGDPKVFDTDRDGVLDGIETYVYFASQSSGKTSRYTAALDSDNLQDNPDGEENALSQIKQHRNPWFPDSETKAYDTRLTPLFNSPTGDCYMFQQLVLPVYKTLEVEAGNTLPGLEHAAGENSVMVYYIQVLQPEPDSVGILKHSVQKIDWGPLSPGLQVKEGIFDEYSP